MRQKQIFSDIMRPRKHPKDGFFRKRRRIKQATPLGSKDKSLRERAQSLQQKREMGNKTRKGKKKKQKTKPPISDFLSFQYGDH